MGHLLGYERALKRLGAPVDVITEDKDFGRYPSWWRPPTRSSTRSW
jgi:hypothetical protein